MTTVKIGFVPGKRDSRAYTNEWAMEMKRRTIAALADVPGLEIVTPDENLTQAGTVRNDDEARQVIKLFRDEGVDGILIGGMDFSDEISSILVAEAFPGVPVMVFATEEAPDLYLPTMEDQTSDSFCGTLSIASGLYRRNIPYLFYGYCNPEDAAFVAAVGRFVRTCAVVRAFRGAYIGQIGPRPGAFETCAIDEKTLLSTHGIRVIPMDTAIMQSAVKALADDDPAVVAVVSAIKAEANTEEIGADRLLDLAKAEVVVARWAKEKQLAGVGAGFALPPYIQGRLTDQAIMVGFEVDIMGCLAMLMQYEASLREEAPFLTDWNLKHPAHDDIFLAWHVGNAPPSMSSSEIRLDQRGMPHFKLQAGDVTFARLEQYDGEYKMLLAKGKALEEGKAEEARFTWTWVEVEDLAKLYKTIGSNGFVHHASMIYGDQIEALVDACYFLDIEVVLVD
ncbi:MAG: L-fucose/L-arabinose isomerase family protein [Anaerolineae bacterium]|jgi:L-fucose isomerase-like protein